MIKQLEGAFAVMVTPFDDQEMIDYQALESNIEWYLARGVHGLMPLGSTGEIASLTKQERLEIAEFVVNKISGRVPVCVGATAETTKETIEYTKHAKSIGADAVLILPPYYFNPIQEEVIYHFETIADAVDLPVMIYNNPGTSGVDIPVDGVLHLAKKDSIQYIKESTGDIKRLRDIGRMSNGTITTFCGCDELALESFMFGAKGWVSVVANALPELSAALFETAVYQKDFDKARDIYEALLPLCIDLESSGKLVQVIKYCLTKRGGHGGNFRAPRLPLTKDHMDKLDQMIQAAEGFLSNMK